MGSKDLAQPLNPSRRRFMVGTAGLTFGVVAASELIKSGEALAAATGTQTAINHYVTLTSDGTVYIMSPAAEMGQGSLTALPRIVADEMDADWSKVVIVPAPPNNKLFGNPAFGGLQYTAGSATVRGYFSTLRQFGAQVRYVVMDNAAQRWGVPLAELTTIPGVVLHEKSGRKLSYGEIAAFMKVPESVGEISLEPVATKSFRLLGTDVGRVDVPSKVNGTCEYSIDVQVPGMVYGAVLRQPVEGAAVEKIDDTAAKAIEGVIAVVPLPYGVGVIADSPWTAFKAKNALKVTWSRKATGWGFSNEKGIEQFKKVAADASQKGVAWDSKGDVHAALAKSASTFVGEYYADYAYHAQMEPLNATAAVSPKGDSCEIWAGGQSQTIAVDAVAAALGIPFEKVKFNGRLLGGGFGRRGNRDAEFIIDAVLMSKAAGKPVKVIWQREDDVHNGRFRPLYVNRISAGIDPAGKITAWHHRVVCDRVLAFMDPVRWSTMKGRDNIAMKGTELPSYSIPDQMGEGLHQDTGMRTAPLRAIGVGQNCFANEVMMDELAAKLAVDPLEFRLKHLAARPRHVMEEVARMADWGRKRAGRGLGVAYLDYDGTHIGGIAEVSVDRSNGAIKVHNFWCALDCGVAVHPDNVVAQSQSSLVYGLGLALTERITIEDGVVQQSNFFDYQVARMKDLPNIEIKLIPTRNNPTGAGQMTTPIAAPAISNAVYQLTGVRLRMQPMLGTRVLAALNEGARKA